MNLTEMRARLAELSNQATTISQNAEAQRRELSSEEQTSLEQITNEFDSIERQVQLLERVELQNARASESQGRRTEPPTPPQRQPDAAPAQRRQVPDDGLRNTRIQTTEERGRWGWNNLGDFAVAIRNHAKGVGQTDTRLMNASLATYSSEGVGADGGFAVPPEFRQTIQNLVMSEDQMLSRCDAMPTESNMVIVPTDEDPSWGASGGVQVYRRAEAGTMTQSKMALKDISVRVEELYALVPVTDQLLSDATILGRFLTTKAGEKINFRINHEIVNGSGAGGQMLGILNSPALITVSKEGSQAADTLVGQNLLKMFSRMPDNARKNAVWLINQDIEPQLYNVNLAFKNAVGSAEIAAGVSGLMPEGGLRYDPTVGTLMGRPIIATEACSTIGDVGDIILAYLPGYFAPYKAGGLKSDISIHLWFDQGVTAFRWTFRIGGQPWLSAPIARRSGSNTLSHFVALEAR
jgi:HK97 family phage major capsid protein